MSRNDYADGLQVDMSERSVSLRIPGEHKKGGKDRAYPAAPEFAELLQTIPQDQRKGFVFNPIPSRKLKGHERAGADLCGRTVARIGDAANVVVDKKTADIVCASSHDLRRSFGLRWSRRIMPPVLPELMRHESIETAMKYYVGQDAQSTAAELYAALESAANLAGLPPTYQAAWADYDNDGDLDLTSAGKLFQNQGSPNSWLKMRLIGDGQTINRLAIGAQVRVKAGEPDNYPASRSWHRRREPKRNDPAFRARRSSGPRQP